MMISQFVTKKVEEILSFNLYRDPAVPSGLFSSINLITNLGLSSSKNAFNGSSTVNFNEVILAGQHGASIEVIASSFEVNTDEILPAKTSMNKNYPNPFNPSTQIEYSLSEAGMVSLVIYDLNGAEVKTLVSEAAQANSYTVAWNGDNNQGNPVASGRYILKMSAPNYSETITMTLLK